MNLNGGRPLELNAVSFDFKKTDEQGAKVVSPPAAENTQRHGPREKMPRKNSRETEEVTQPAGGDSLNSGKVVRAATKKIASLLP